MDFNNCYKNKINKEENNIFKIYVIRMRERDKIRSEILSSYLYKFHLRKNCKWSISILLFLKIFFYNIIIFIHYIKICLGKIVLGHSVANFFEVMILWSISELFRKNKVKKKGYKSTFKKRKRKRVLILNYLQTNIMINWYITNFRMLLIIIKN